MAGGYERISYYGMSVRLEEILEEGASLSEDMIGKDFYHILSSPFSLNNRVSPAS